MIMSLSRTLACFVLLSLTAGAAAAQSVKTMRETLPLDARGTVAIDSYKGSITVTTWDRNEIEIDVRIVADEDAGLVDRTDIDIETSGDRVRIKSDYDRAKMSRGLFGGRVNVSLPFVHYTIKMPRTARLAIDDYKSDIRVADLRADLTIDTYKGTVDVRDLVGDLALETYKGTVRVAGLKGALDLETYKGDVEIAFSALEGDSQVETYKGDVALVLPRQASFNLDADMNRRGRFDTDFDVARVGGDRRDTAYRGAVNGGGPRLALETTRGTYRLRAR